ncbi:Mitogen-activated protein kinase kinase kinase 10 [Manis javanica]|nr:Mitogen-activated protein kinase kinase kinase 10 [Manis javanica]
MPHRTSLRPVAARKTGEPSTQTPLEPGFLGLEPYQMAGFEDARLVGPEQDSVSLQLVPADVSRASDAPTLSPSPARPARCPVAPSGWAQAYGKRDLGADRCSAQAPRAVTQRPASLVPVHPRSAGGQREGRKVASVPSRHTDLGPAPHLPAVHVSHSNKDQEGVL